MCEWCAFSAPLSLAETTVLALDDPRAEGRHHNIIANRLSPKQIHVAVRISSCPGGDIALWLGHALDLSYDASNSSTT